VGTALEPLGAVHPSRQAASSSLRAAWAALRVDWGLSDTADAIAAVLAAVEALFLMAALES